MAEEKKTDEKSVDEVKVEEKKDSAKTSSVGGACCGSECSEGSNIFVWLIVIVLAIGVVIFFTQRGGDKETEVKPVSDKVSEEVSAAALAMVEEN